MELDFCPGCGKPLIPRRVGEERFILVCVKCDFFKEFKGEPLVRTDKVENENKGEGFVEGGNEMAIYDHVCKKCGYSKAQIMDMGVSYSDEDNLILLKCGKCGFAERIGEKVS